MAYTRKNKLKKIITIQNITLQHTAKGVRQSYIFEHYIKPVFNISQSTYYNYLRTNAKKGLKELETKNNA